MKSHRLCILALFCTGFSPPALGQTSPYPYVAPSCTAKEVTVSNFDAASVEVQQACSCATDTALLKISYTINANTNRYDILAGFAVNGLMQYDTCVSASAPGSTGFSDIDGENDCGDISSAGAAVQEFTIQLPCDSDGDGEIDPAPSVQLFSGWAAGAGGAGYDPRITDPKCSRLEPPFEYTLGAGVTLTKLSEDGTGTFGFGATSVCEQPNDITTVGAGIPTMGTGIGITGYDPVSGQFTQDLVLSEDTLAGWDLEGITCSVGGVADLTARTFTIPAANISLGDNIACTFTNRLAAASEDRSDLPANGSDAPDGTVGATAYDDATHTVVAGVRLGGAVDADAAAISDPAADGDGTDDDGVILPALYVGGSGAVVVTVFGAAGGLNAWIDWDGSGAFDNPAEQVATDLVDADGDGTISFDVTAPAWAITGETFARFRWSTDFAIGPSGAAPDGEVEDYILPLSAPGALLSGTVFADTGAGLGTAHDGAINGDETGAALAALTLTDSTGAELATPEVGADGRWSVALPPGFGGALTLSFAANAGYLPISEQATGLPSLVNADPHDGSFTFTPASGGTYATLDFGAVPLPLLSQNQSGSLQPGQVLELSHRYEATSAATVSFALVDEVAAPDGAFSATLFRDNDCDGSADSVLLAPVSVVAGDSICLTVRSQASSAAGDGSSFSYGLTADTAFTGTTFTNALRNDDRIGSNSESELRLSKLVTNLTRMTPETTVNEGAGGDELRYRIVLNNPGTSEISNIRIVDQTPAWTALTDTLASSVTVISGVDCALLTPSGGGSPGYTGALEWACTGVLGAGEEGSLTFDVTIQ